MTHPSTVADTLDAGHTPGPWAARPDARDNGEWEVVKHDKRKPFSDDPWFVCACFDDADGRDAEYNARLIAAAPELLAACIAAEDFCAAEPGDPAYSIYRQLHAAIAKARGEVRP